MATKILMIGWEFPPVYSGGLGVVCQQLASALAEKDIQISFLVPHNVQQQLSHKELDMPFLFGRFEEPVNLEMIPIESKLYSPYQQPEDQPKEQGNAFCLRPDIKKGLLYGDSFFYEIYLFIKDVEKFARENTDFSIIHAHDWMTFEAGIAAKNILDIPLVFHIHSTEIERTGENPHQEVFIREKTALQYADKIIAVSEQTKSVLIKHYEVSADKIAVVHNAIDSLELPCPKTMLALQKRKKRFQVLFMGRITLQKGPDYFVEMAKKVLAINPDITFVLAGTGDMLPRILEDIAANGLQNNIFCVGFLDEEEKAKAYASSDCLVVPSLAEPFGLIGLEAAAYHLPMVLTKTAGVKEVVPSSLTFDFWDIDAMAAYVLSLEKFPVLRETMAKNAYHEAQKISWEAQSEKVKNIYHSLLS